MQNKSESRNSKSERPSIRIRIGTRIGSYFGFLYSDFGFPCSLFDIPSDCFAATTSRLAMTKTPRNSACPIPVGCVFARRLNTRAKEVEGDEAIYSIHSPRPDLKAVSNFDPDSYRDGFRIFLVPFSVFVLRVSRRESDASIP